MKDFRDRVAVITGAGSGIGRALALRLARRGAHLAISDVDEEGLAETAKQVAGHGRVTTHRLDVADREAVYAHVDEVEREHGGAHLVVNNAGVALVASARRSTPSRRWNGSWASTSGGWSTGRRLSCRCSKSSPRGTSSTSRASSGSSPTR